jgi:hypothetical protein
MRTTLQPCDDLEVGRNAHDFEPIAGVSLASFVAVSLELARFQFDAGRAVDVALEQGISAREWAAATRGWSRRLQTSPTVATEFERLYLLGRARQPIGDTTANGRRD